MRPVERQDDQTKGIEVQEPNSNSSGFWMYPSSWQIDVYDFPAGPFTVASAIIGGVLNYWTGNFALSLLSLRQPVVLFLWIVLGIGIGISAAIKFINWLIDNSPD